MAIVGTDQKLVKSTHKTILPLSIRKVGIIEKITERKD
jgi:hypothetical protein